MHAARNLRGDLVASSVKLQARRNIFRCF